MIKKSALFLSLICLLLSSIFLSGKAEARITNKGLAVTGVALGAAAVGLYGYNTIQNRRDRRGYYQRSPRYSRPNYYAPSNYAGYGRGRGCRDQYGYGYQDVHYGGYDYY